MRTKNTDQDDCDSVVNEKPFFYVDNSPGRVDMISQYLALQVSPMAP